MTGETLAMTREDSDSRLMTRDLRLITHYSSRDLAPGKRNDSRQGTCDSTRDSTAMTRAQL